MTRGMTNPELISTITELRKKSRTDGAALWQALARELDHAKRKRVAVNLSRLNRNSAKGEVVAVPGKVLAAGDLNHPLTIAAFSFSSMALNKIALAKGKTLSLKELIGSGIPPSEIKILK